MLRLRECHCASALARLRPRNCRNAHSRLGTIRLRAVRACHTGWQPWRRAVSFHVRQSAIFEKSQPEPVTGAHTGRLARAQQRKIYRAAVAFPTLPAGMGAQGKQPARGPAAGRNGARARPSIALAASPSPSRQHVHTRTPTTRLEEGPLAAYSTQPKKPASGPAESPARHPRPTYCRSFNSIAAIASASSLTCLRRSSWRRSSVFTAESKCSSFSSTLMSSQSPATRLPRAIRVSQRATPASSEVRTSGRSHQTPLFRQPPQTHSRTCEIASERNPPRRPNISRAAPRTHRRNRRVRGEADEKLQASGDADPTHPCHRSIS